MKKILLVLAVLVLFGGAVSAQEEQGPIRLDFSSGLYYDAYPMEDMGGFEIIAALFNLRVGGLVGLGFNIGEAITVGGEVGALAMYWSDNSGSYSILFDLPVHAYADVHLGEAVALRVYGGGIGLGYWTNSFFLGFAPEVGARASLGGLYVEAAYVLSAEPFYRYGIGFTANAFSDEE